MAEESKSRAPCLPVPYPVFMVLLVRAVVGGSVLFALMLRVASSCIR